MYIYHSIIEGLKILGFDKETIKKVSKEKSLEEIFLSTLFLNYVIVLVVFLMGVTTGGFTIGNRDLNMTVFFGLLMIYPFAFNVIVYLIYGMFGVVAELLNSHKKVKPLISVGFHTAIVYTLVFYIIGLLTLLFDAAYGLFMMTIFVIYFLLTMFLSVVTIYNFSNAQALIVLFVPLLVLGLFVLVMLAFIDLSTIIGWFF